MCTASKGKVIGPFQSQLKKGIDFVDFGLEPGMVFKGTTGVYKRIYFVILIPKGTRKQDNMRI